MGRGGGGGGRGCLIVRGEVLTALHSGHLQGEVMAGGGWALQGAIHTQWVVHHRVGFRAVEHALGTTVQGGTHTADTRWTLERDGRYKPQDQGEGEWCRRGRGGEWEHGYKRMAP